MVLSELVLADNISVIIGGVLLGGVYGLTALGLTLIFGVSRILNVAHGDFLMLGGLVSFFVFIAAGLNPFLALLVLLPLFFLVGGSISFFLIRPISSKPVEILLASSILITLGLSMVVEDLTAFGISLQGLNYFAVPFRLPAVNIFEIIIPSVRLLSLVVIAAMAVAMQFFIAKSQTGRTIRAIMQDREGAVAIGVNTTRVSLLSFGIGTALAAMAGAFVVMITSLTAYAGLPLTIKALTIIILGGLGSFVGAIIGAIILGLAESYTSFFLGANWAPPVSIIILIAILLVRPQGLFGRR